MKLLASAVAALLILANTGCAAPAEAGGTSSSASEAPTETDIIGELNQLSLEEAMARLEAAGVGYQVRVQGPEGIHLDDPKAPSEQGKWKALGLIDASTEAIILSTGVAAGDFVKILAAPLVEPSETASLSPDSTPTPEEPSGMTIKYVVTADGPISTSTFGNMVGGSLSTEQANDEVSPVTKEYFFPYEDVDDGFNSFSVTAQAGDGTTTISCEIFQNGKVIKKQTSTGSYAVVRCNGD